MKWIYFILILVSSFISSPDIINGQNVREKINFDDNWKFHLGNAKDPEKNFNYGAHSSIDLKLADDYKKLKKYAAILTSEFDDNDWNTITLPHDWAVELPFVEQPELYQGMHGYKPIGAPFPENSIGWYRKNFNVALQDSVFSYTLQFDGVYRNCKVFINGNFVCSNKSGYTSFDIDITSYLFFGKSNQIVVYVDASQFEGWWYEGAGIYRHVWLIKTNPVHIPVNGIFAYAEIKSSKAKLHIETTIANKSCKPAGCEIQSYIMDSQEKIIASSKISKLDLGYGNKNIIQEINISRPHLWSTEDPYLYKIVSLIKHKAKIIDSVSVPFGFRTVLAASNGLFLNGKYLKIKGFCNHQDHSGVGIAVPDAVEYYRLKLLKEIGTNAIRIHHAVSPALLDMCDRMGILVLNETRQFSAGNEAMEEWERLIIRDRNHPSVFMWCLGNEQNILQDTENGKRIALTMIAKQKELDPLRTSTFAANNGGKFRKGINLVIPVRGFNYRVEESVQYKKDNPNQPVLITEAASSQSTRGIYFTNEKNKYKTDYDKACEKWWKIAAANNWNMGGFSWTGFDYRGEDSWPNVVCNYGIMDICGFPKNAYYYYKSWWTNEDVLHIFPHWNWKGKEGEDINVWCYSNADNVELFLNGKSLGKKGMPRNGHIEWAVKYQPGNLKAVAYKNGRKLEEIIKTTDEPYKIIADPDRTVITADGKDAVIINYSAQDKNGLDVPDAGNLLHFKIYGDARIIGAGNGDPGSMEPDKYTGNNYQRRLFNGKCQIIVQSGTKAGSFEVEADAEGLQKSSLTIRQNK